MATRYSRGRQFEYRTQRELERLGYETLRSAGSKGRFDVVAWRKTDIRLIQTKRTEGNPAHAISELEMEKIRDMETPPSCSREIWIWFKRGGRWEVEVMSA